MIKLILALTLALSFTAQADNVELCTKYADKAKAIMGARQGGIELSYMLSVTKNKLAHSLIMQAYKLPTYSGDEYQKKAVLRFANKAMLECMKAIGQSNERT